MTIVNLPTYVERGGRTVWQQPYRSTDTYLLGLVLRADPTKIDKLLQRDLVAPAGGAVDYRCAHPHVLLTLSSVATMASFDPPDALLGAISEHEVALWCLVADMSGGERLVWHIPYIWTNSGQTVDTGREVYGYPKQLGYFDQQFEATLTGPGVTEMKAMAIQQFAANAHAQPELTLSVKRTAVAGTAGLVAAADWVRDAENGPLPGEFSVNTHPASAPPDADVVITVDPNDTPAPPPPKPVWHKAPITQVLGGGLAATRLGMLEPLINDPKLVFLKQFRDVQCPTKACYQAIVEAPLSINPAGSFKPTFSPLEPTEFEVGIANWNSSPITDDLGLEPQDQLQTVEAAFEAHFNFDVLTGLEVWRAPT